MHVLPLKSFIYIKRQYHCRPIGENCWNEHRKVVFYFQAQNCRL